MDVMVVLNQMIELFLIMGLGYFLMKVHLLNETANKTINSLIVSVTTPALVIASVYAENTVSKQEVIFVLLVSIGLFVVLPMLGILVANILRVSKEEKNMYIFMTIFSNVGFMGYPVMQSMFGSTAVFYAAIINLMFNLMTFTIGVYLMQKGSKFDFRKLCTPGVISSIVAVLFFLFDVPMFSIVVNVCDSVGGLTSPLAMLLIGANLAMIPLKSVFTNKRLYVFTVIKQIIIPILFYPILCILIDNFLIRGVFFVLIAMPVANISVILATQYEYQQELATKGVFITTLCSIVTIPICALILTL